MSNDLMITQYSETTFSLAIIRVISTTVFTIVHMILRRRFITYQSWQNIIPVMFSCQNIPAGSYAIADRHMRCMSIYQSMSSIHRRR